MEISMKCVSCNAVNFYIPQEEKKVRRCRVCGGILKEFTVDMKENGVSVIPPQPVFLDILRVVIEKNSAAMSMIQRYCSVGYNCAGRAVEWMEGNGYVSKFEKGVPRKVLITKEQFEENYGPFDVGVDAYYPQTEAAKEETSPLDVKEELLPLYVEALRKVVAENYCSISFIQHKSGCGYMLSGKILDWMEAKGFVAAFDGGKSRRVLITKEEFENLYGALDKEE